MMDLVLAMLVAATKPPASPNAPVDQYFGQFKMSAIRIRLEIDDLAVKYERRTESDADIMHDAAIDVEALHVWLERYPHDGWGAPTSFHLAQLYAEIQTPEARAAAKTAYTYVATHYGSSKQGHLARERLTQGFPPLHAESPLAASPAPSDAPSAPPSSVSSPGPAASDAPSTSVSPGASASPAMSASPTTSASPATSASPSSGATPYGRSNLSSSVLLKRANSDSA